MKTNFYNTRFLVLANDENIPLAVIEFIEGEQDITNKILSVLFRETDAETVEILQPSPELLDDDNYQWTLRIQTQREGEEATVEIFELTACGFYRN